MIKIPLALALSLAAVPALAGPDSLEDAFSRGQAAAVSVSRDPCIQNQQFNFFELLAEAVPLYAPTRAVRGAPPRSVILTMSRCESRDRDHVEGHPMTPTAERWYTEGSFGLILTTPQGSDKTWITVVAKRNGAWVNAGQMGEFANDDLYDLSGKAKAAVKLIHYEQGGVELSYQMHAAFRPSWNR